MVVMLHTHTHLYIEIQYPKGVIRFRADGTCAAITNVFRESSSGTELNALGWAIASCECGNR